MAELLSRRGAIKTLGVAAACGLPAAARAQTYQSQAQVKLSKTAARYQDAPKGNESCGSCPYFVLPRGCVTVEGDISPTAWCPMYTTFAALDRGAHSAGR